MKKLLLIITLGLSMVVNAQKDDQQKILDLMKLSTDNIGNKSKLDSIKSEAEKIYETTASVPVAMMAKKFVKTLNGFDNIVEVRKPQTKKLSEVDEKVLKDFRVKEDKFKNMTFITAKKPLAWNYGFYPYIVLSDGKVNLRLVVNYQGSDWIFFNTVKFVIDGENFEYSDSDVDTQISNGVFESSDVSVDSNIDLILNKIINSKNKIEYRLSGKYRKDRVLTEKEISVIKETYSLYLDLTK